MQNLARLGFLIPPGNPNTEGEVIQMSRPEFSVHFTRMVAFGETGSLLGQDERNQSQIDHLDENLELMKLVKPSVVAMAHTANSYTLGKDGEAKLVDRLQKKFDLPFITAFGSVVTALRQIGVSNIAFGTPYSEQNTLRCKNLLEEYGFNIVSFGNLPGVKNIYDETPERAAQLMQQVDVSGADALFVSGVGMPTIDALENSEKILGKPIISSIAATMWNSLRIAGVSSPILGYGSLLAGKYN
jgi:maleate cis-trans isomerase